MQQCLPWKLFNQERTKEGKGRVGSEHLHMKGYASSVVSGTKRELLEKLSAKPGLARRVMITAALRKSHL